MVSLRHAAVHETAEWPADAAAIDAARSFLHGLTGAAVAVACDSDADGLAAAAIVERAAQTLGGVPHVLPARRGEHVHRQSMLARIRTVEPASLIVVDMGSRPEPILPDTPTLIVDHHHASRGVPPGALVVNGFDRPPVAPSSVLAYVICRTVPGVENRAWLAAIGAVADLGSAAPFADLIGVRAGGTLWTRAVALLNAARRASTPDPAVALDALRRARSIHDITSGRLPETRVLEGCLQEVRAEIERCARVPPAFAGDVALVRFSSGAQVHPVIAIRWARRLRPRIVIAANDGYIQGRTNFAVRCDGDVDLVAWLRSLPFAPSPDAEYAHGHTRATGGSLSEADFGEFLRVLGLVPPAAGTAAIGDR